MDDTLFLQAATSCHILDRRQIERLMKEKANRMRVHPQITLEEIAIELEMVDQTQIDTMQSQWNAYRMPGSKTGRHTEPTVVMKSNVIEQQLSTDHPKNIDDSPTLLDDIVQIVQQSPLSDDGLKINEAESAKEERNKSLLPILSQKTSSHSLESLPLLPPHSVDSNPNPITQIAPIQAMPESYNKPSLPPISADHHEPIIDIRNSQLIDLNPFLQQNHQEEIPNPIKLTTNAGSPPSALNADQNSPPFKKTQATPAMKDSTIRDDILAPLPATVAKRVHTPPSVPAMRKTATATLQKQSKTSAPSISVTPSSNPIIGQNNQQNQPNANGSVFISEIETGREQKTDVQQPTQSNLQASVPAAFHNSPLHSSDLLKDEPSIIDVDLLGWMRINCPWPKPGDMLARYKIVKLIGQGGMGRVYQAFDTVMKRPVAIKLLEPNNITNDIKDEMAQLAQLSHSNIVTVYDTGKWAFSVKTDQGERRACSRYLVMEFVDGTALKQLIQKDKPLPIKEACRITRQVLDGLNHMHEKAMIHCDIKPANILITKQGNVKIIDFGITQKSDQKQKLPLTKEQLAQQTTHQGNLDHAVGIGTLPYMSPEQMDAQILDCRSDIYSLGITFYEMLAGRPPFPPPYDLIQLSKAEPIPLTEYGSFPRVLSKIVHKMIEKSPQRRYQNVPSILHDLHIQNDENTSGWHWVITLSLLLWLFISSNFSWRAIFFYRSELGQSIVSYGRSITQVVQQLFVREPSILTLCRSEYIPEKSNVILILIGYDQFKNKMEFQSIRDWFSIPPNTIGCTVQSIKGDDPYQGKFVLTANTDVTECSAIFYIGPPFNIHEAEIGLCEIIEFKFKVNRTADGTIQLLRVE